MEFQPHWWQLFLLVNLIMFVVCSREIENDFKGVSYTFRWAAVLFGSAVFWLLYFAIVSSFTFG